MDHLSPHTKDDLGEGRVNDNLLAHSLIKIINQIIDRAHVCHCGVMESSWRIYIACSNVSVGRKQKQIGDVMAMRPSIEKNILHKLVSRFFQSQLQSIHGPPTVWKSWILCENCCFKLTNFIIGRHHHFRKRIVSQKINQETPRKSKPRRKMARCKTKDYL